MFRKILNAQADAIAAKTAEGGQMGMGGDAWIDFDRYFSFGRHGEPCRQDLPESFQLLGQKKRGRAAAEVDLMDLAVQ